jgi:predicted MFS family arabinose efflux permease
VRPPRGRAVADADPGEGFPRHRLPLGLGALRWCCSRRSASSSTSSRFSIGVIGRERAAVAVALLTAMAVVGRVLFSFVIDRMNQRLASSISFVSQAVALLIVINVRNDIALIAACALFGFSVGNLITLPALIVQREFDPRSFGVLVSLITAINQITYAFGPA